MLSSPTIAQTVWLALFHFVIDAWLLMMFFTVAVSRAKEGLFILGNAENLASRSEMWRSIVEELENNECLGDALPIACPNHPEAVEYISQPGKLPRIAPDGMPMSCPCLLYHADADVSAIIAQVGA